MASKYVTQSNNIHLFMLLKCGYLVLEARISLAVQGDFPLIINYGNILLYLQPSYTVQVDNPY